MIVGDYKIRWNHINHLKQTMCIVSNETLNEDDGILRIGIAQCGEKDQFNKEIGRKISLIRVMKLLNFDKELRTEVWNKYKNFGGKKRW